MNQTDADIGGPGHERGSKNLAPTPTSTTNISMGDQPGSHVVDGCYMTPDVRVHKAVWPAVYKCPSNHQMPIVELDFNDCLGESIHRIVHPPVR